jgi:hypothetical protein
MRDVVNEASACTWRVSFEDADGNPETPTTVHWKLNDLTNCRTLQDWVQIPAQSVVDIDITPEQNAISGTCHDYQELVLSIQTDQGLDTQASGEQRYVVANLTGFTS